MKRWLCILPLAVLLAWTVSCGEETGLLKQAEKQPPASAGTPHKPAGPISTPFIMSTEPAVVDFDHGIGLAGKMLDLPESTESAEHFCAMETGPDGLIYYGTCNTTGGAGSPSDEALKEGQFSVKCGAHFCSIDPANGRQVDLGNMQEIIGEDTSKVFPQSKVHSMIDFDDNGIAYFGTHSAQWYAGTKGETPQKAELYPGGHVMSYNPRSRSFTDHGILVPHESIIPSAYDKKRRRFYALTHPNNVFAAMDLDTGKTTIYDYGKQVDGPPRGMACDDFGRVFCFVSDGVVRYSPDTDKLEILKLFPKGMEQGISLSGVALGPLVYKKGKGPGDDPATSTHRLIYGAADAGGAVKGPGVRAMFVEYDPDDGPQGSFRVVGEPYNFDGEYRTMAINRGPDGNIYYMACYGNTDKAGGGRVYVYLPRENALKYVGQITVDGRPFHLGTTGLAVSNDGTTLTAIGFRPSDFKPVRPEGTTVMTDALAIVGIRLDRTAQLGMAEDMEGPYLNTGHYLNGDYPYDPARLDKITFLYPTPAWPYYEIAVPFTGAGGIKGNGVSEFKVEGETPVVTYWMVDGRYKGTGIRDDQTVGRVVWVARMPWVGGKEYAFTARLQPPGENAQAREVRLSATAPAEGALEGWKYIQPFVIEEQAGKAREAEPVEMTILARQSEVADLGKELRLVEIDPDTGKSTQVPFQTFAFDNFDGEPAAGQDYLKWPGVQCRMLFLADVPANGKKVYAYYYGNPKAEAPPVPQSDLSITGDGLGATVENSYYRLKLDDKCGQILHMELKGPDGKSRQLLGPLRYDHGHVMHWNPDVYTAYTWGHTSGWGKEQGGTTEIPTVVTHRGPLAYRVTRHGAMPGVPEVTASVTYTFYANNPHIEVTTLTEVNTPLAVSAIRNCEFVFNMDIFDRFTWREKNGSLRTLRARLPAKPGLEDGAARLETDTPWICMTQTGEKYSFGVMPLASHNANKLTGIAGDYRPSFYLYSHPEWGKDHPYLMYFVRTLAYPFGYGDSGPSMMADKGNFYADRFAVMPFWLDTGRPFDLLDGKTIRLRNPLRLHFYE